MLPLTSESGQWNLFLIQESTVLTSKCNSAPQAAVISSVIMAENGIEGNQINRGVMDRWRGVSNVCLHPLSLSHMQLFSPGPSRWIIILGCRGAENRPALVMKVLRICREGTCEYMQIGRCISIWYPRGCMGRAMPRCGGGVCVRVWACCELGRSEIAIHSLRASLTLEHWV